MSINEFINKMEIIEEKLLNFLEQDDSEEENYDNFIKKITEEGVLNNKYDLKTVLYIIDKITKNHYRYQNFIKKIEQILKQMKEKIKQFYFNDEIFKIFKKNKRILLFLLEEKIIIFDKYVYEEMNRIKYAKMHYREFFSPEMRKFETQKNCDSTYNENIDDNNDEKIDEKFNEKRKIGENDNYLYQIIREDLIEKFIIYVNKEFLSINSNVTKSIFETNNFLIEQDQTTLIEYASFYGSNQIFKYLYKNGAKITNNLWLYAIHGCDSEIIHYLEENTSLDFYLVEQIQIQSIKCHHNFITKYIKENLMKNDEKNFNILLNCFKHYNFYDIDISDIYTNNKKIFNYACKYDHYQDNFNCIICNNNWK